MLRLRSLLGVALSAALLTGCGEDAPTDPGNPTPVPDFSIPDTNTTSPRAGEDVSPRDYVGSTSAWYFGHAT